MPSHPKLSLYWPLPRAPKPNLSLVLCVKYATLKRKRQPWSCSPTNPWFLICVLPLGIFHLNTNVTHTGTYERANISWTQVTFSESSLMMSIKVGTKCKPKEISTQEGSHQDIDNCFLVGGRRVIAEIPFSPILYFLNFLNWKESWHFKNCLIHFFQPPMGPCIEFSLVNNS